MFLKKCNPRIPTPLFGPEYFLFFLSAVLSYFAAQRKSVKTGNNKGRYLKMLVSIWILPGCTRCWCSRTGTASRETRAFAWPSRGWRCIRKDRNLETKKIKIYWNKVIPICICWQSYKIDTCMPSLFEYFLSVILMIWKNWKFYFYCKCIAFHLFLVTYPLVSDQ